MPAQNYVLLERVEVGEAGASSITFNSIPQTGYTDLKVVVSGREVTGTSLLFTMRINGLTTNQSTREIRGNGSAATSGTNTIATIDQNGSGTTASTFGNAEIYIPNYTSANFKSISIDSTSENNATAAYMRLSAGLWSQTAAITSLSFFPSSGTIAQYSSFSLYGLAAVGTTPTRAPKASGGSIIQTDGTYWYHAFLASGTFTPAVGLSCDVLVVAGGGGGSDGPGGGGGAGGYRTTTSLSVSTATTVTVGGGGTGGTSSPQTAGVAGTSSIFSSIASSGGGGGGTQAAGSSTGGSGGGGSWNGAGSAGNSGSYSPVEGYAGGAGRTGGGAGNPYATGGGGGAAAVGATATISGSGAGGIGSFTTISGGATTNVGILSSGNYYFAGGGGGGADATRLANSQGAGGIGGGGAGSGTSSVNGTAAIANTGGGGGGGANGGTGAAGGKGGSGIVIIRYAV